MNEVTTGTCRCGQLRLTVQGAPLVTMACHCTGCQKMTASAFSLSSLYPQEAVTIQGDLLRGGLKDQWEHMFCANCLSWVLSRGEMLGPLVNIRSSMLDDGNAQAPFIECWLDEKLPWASIGATHAYAQFPPVEQFETLMAEFAASRVAAA